MGPRFLAACGSPRVQDSVVLELEDARMIAPSSLHFRTVNSPYACGSERVAPSDPDLREMGVELLRKGK